MFKKMQPRKVRLEMSSYCQLRCPSCPTTTHAIAPTVGHGFLSLLNFNTFLDRHPWITDIQVANYGEIFLNPDLLAIIQSAAERGVRLRADTGVNLNYAPAEVLEGLVKYKFRSLSCSIDGATEAIYAQYRVRGSLPRVLENIRTINAWKHHYRSPYPLLTWQFVVFGHNEHELSAARQLARTLQMDFRPKLSWDEELSPVQEATSTRHKGGRPVASRSAYARQHGVAYMDHLCYQLWEEPQINWDGKILGCARNFWGDFGGNAFADGLGASLNTEQLSAAKQMLRGQRAALPNIPCSRCDVYLTRQAQGKRLHRGIRRAAYRRGRDVYRCFRAYRWYSQHWKARLAEVLRGAARPQP